MPFNPKICCSIDNCTDMKLVDENVIGDIAHGNFFPLMNLPYIHAPNFSIYYYKLWQERMLFVPRRILLSNKIVFHHFSFKYKFSLDTERVFPGFHFVFPRNSLFVKENITKAFFLKDVLETYKVLNIICFLYFCYVS